MSVSSASWRSCRNTWPAAPQVRLWDVSAGEQVVRLTGHTDYVRAAAASPSSSDSWATGVWRLDRSVYCSP